MQFCTLIVFDLLNSNQLRDKAADSQWGRRIWHFKMDITGAYLIGTTTKTVIV